MPGGKIWVLILLIFSRTRANTSEAFSPRRKNTIPSTASGLSSYWNIPKRGANPISTVATSPIRMGTPWLIATTTCLISAKFLNRPTPLTTNCCSPVGNKPPPALLFALLRALITCVTVMPFACKLSGVIITWYCRTLPPKDETSATPGVCLSSL